jgi:hypothetical protein
MKACKLVAGCEKLFPPSSGQKRHFQNPNKHLQIAQYYNPSGRERSVGIATRYGLDDPGIESRCGRNFPRPSREALGSPSLLYNGYRFFPGVKRPGRVVDHQLHLVPRLKKEQSYTSTPTLSLRGLLYGDLSLTVLL